MHDAEFFTHLIRDRRLPDFRVTSAGYVARAPSGREGVGYLTPALDALPAIPNFQSLKGILIAADNDSDPSATFADVQRAIRATADMSPGVRYEAPQNPLSKAGSNPAIVIMMVPWIAIPGALESLCLRSAIAKRPQLSQPVDDFAQACGVNANNGWPIVKEQKMRLRALISAAHRDNPYISPAWVWREGTDLVPLSDGSFDQIANFLAGFAALLAAP
jgi:hypothetical protein